MEEITTLPLKERYKNLYLSYSHIFSLILNGIEKELKQKIQLASLPTYKSRIKSFPSYYKKVLRQKPDELGDGTRIVPLTDMIGIRVICAFLEDLAEVEKQICSIFNVMEIERKGAEQTFKEFGYESVHILVEIPKTCLPEENMLKMFPLPEGIVCEIQIRTILQDAWAEVEHELVYKSDFNPFDKPLRRKLASINASLTLADIVFQEIRDYQKKLQGEIAYRRNTFYEKADDITDEELGLAPKEKESLTAIDDDDLSITGTIDDLVLAALQAHNNGKLDKAVRIYTQIITSMPEPNNAALSVIYKHRGMAFFAQNNYEKALDDFKKSVSYDPKGFRALYYEGIVYSVLEKNKEAIECFDQSLAIEGFQSHVYYRRALAYYNTGDYQQALSDLDNAAKLGLDDDDCKLLRSKLVKKFDMSM